MNTECDTIVVPDGIAAHLHLGSRSLELRSGKPRAERLKVPDERMDLTSSEASPLDDVLGSCARCSDARGYLYFGVDVVRKNEIADAGLESEFRIAPLPKHMEIKAAV